VDALPRWAWQGGAVVPFGDAGVSLADRGLLFGESLYEVLPLTRGEVRFVDEHHERMQAAARELGLLGGAPRRDDWIAIGRALASAESIDEGFLYAQLTGGVAPRGHLPPATRTPTFFAFVGALRMPRAEEIERAVTLVSHEDIRWARCDLKTTMLLPSVLGKIEAEQRGADEIVFFAGDELREGGSSTVGIVEGDAVILVQPSPHVLPGVTQRVLLRIAPDLGLAVRLESIDRARLVRADEVFIASTTRTVLPARTLDAIPLRRGPIVADLAARIRRELALDA
jgi:D-alanine transaminase